MKTIHEAVLGKKLVRQGFRLEEDEDFAYLYLNDGKIGTYNASMVTVAQLRADAAKKIQEEQK